MNIPSITDPSSVQHLQKRVGNRQYHFKNILEFYKGSQFSIQLHGFYNSDSNNEELQQPIQSNNKPKLTFNQASLNTIYKDLFVTGRDILKWTI